MVFSKREPTGKTFNPAMIIFILAIVSYAVDFPLLVTIVLGIAAVLAFIAHFLLKKKKDSK